MSGNHSGQALLSLMGSHAAHAKSSRIASIRMFGLTLQSTEMAMDQNNSKPVETHRNAPFLGMNAKPCTQAILVFTRAIEFKLYQNFPAISSWHLDFIHQRLNWLASSQVEDVHPFSAQRAFHFVRQSLGDAGRAEDMLTPGQSVHPLSSKVAPGGRQP